MLNSKPTGAPIRFVMTLDGVEYPIVFEEITARQVGDLAIFFGREPLSLRDRILAQEIDVVDAVALMWVSKRQHGELADPDELLDTVTIGAECSVTYEEPSTGATGLDADPEP